MKKINIWSGGSMFIVFMIMLPIFKILKNLLNQETKVWVHIREHLMMKYVATSFALVLGTVVLSIIIGVSLAWFITVYEFPFRNFLKFAVILPIAIPPYIGAYTYVGLLSYTGPIQYYLRAVLNMKINQKYFSIMNLPGAIFIFSIFLYPYVYIAAKSFLEKNSSQLIESGRLLGDNHFKIFFRIILPLLRGPIVAGSTIVALDVLSDFAVVSYFGIGVFSSAIFKAWQHLHDIHSALKLSAILMIGVLFITSLEKIQRRSKKFALASTKIRPIQPLKINFLKQTFIVVYSLFITSVALFIPISYMVLWAVYSYKNISKSGLAIMTFNTIWLAGFSATIIVILSMIIVNYKRLSSGLVSKIVAKLSTIGYSIPSAVIAISVLVLFLDISPVLSRTIVMVIFAYIVRYFAIAFSNIENGFDKIGLGFHNASRTLGHSKLSTFFRVDLPMIGPALAGAFILTFVDIAKELTLILILRPFNFYTLSTKVFEYAHDEMIPESSIASLLIILISSIPIFIYYIKEKKERA